MSDWWTLKRIQRFLDSVSNIYMTLHFCWLVSRLVDLSLVCHNFQKRAGNYTFMLQSEHLFSLHKCPRLLFSWIVWRELFETLFVVKLQVWYLLLSLIPTTRYITISSGLICSRNFLLHILLTFGRLVKTKILFLFLSF